MSDGKYGLVSHVEKNRQNADEEGHDVELLDPQKQDCGEG
jgi:hypothetical protein